MKFPYSKYFLGRPSRLFGSYVEYPTVNIDLINPSNGRIATNYIVLVDSGAAMCVFHANIAESLGIDVESVIPMPLRGVGPFPGKHFVHTIELVLGGHHTILEAGFSYDLNIPFGLLGQKGFFEKFRICFDLPKRDFEIVPKER